MKARYNSLSNYLKERFGDKVYKLALDGGMYCPNRDGKVGLGGCIFCSEGGSGDFAERRTDSIDEQIERAKQRVKDKIHSGKYIAYFQSYTNTYAPIEYLESVFYPAIFNESIVALSIATRPDCLDEDVLTLLAKLNAIKPVFVELGLQTIHEETARLINRCYPLKTYETAVSRLHEIGINVVTHLIIGLPDETREMMIESAKYVSSKTDGVKLQLLHVMKGTALEKMYSFGRFDVLSLEEYISVLCDIINVLDEKIVIHRLTGDAPKKSLIAPEWSADKKRVLNEINRIFDEKNVIQGSLKDAELKK